MIEPLPALLDLLLMSVVAPRLAAAMVVAVKEEMRSRVVEVAVAVAVRWGDGRAQLLLPLVSARLLALRRRA